MKTSQERFHEQELRKEEIRQTEQTFKLVGGILFVSAIILFVLIA